MLFLTAGPALPCMCVWHWLLVGRLVYRMTEVSWGLWVLRFHPSSWHTRRPARLFPSLDRYSETERSSVVSGSLRPHGILPGFSVHGVLQARRLEWVAIPFSRGSSQPQGLNPDLPHCRQILYCLSHQGRPGKLEWSFPRKTEFLLRGAS